MFFPRPLTINAINLVANIRRTHFSQTTAKRLQILSFLHTPCRNARAIWGARASLREHSG